MRRPAVDAYPALLLHTPTGVHDLGGPVASAVQLIDALDQYLAPAT